MIHDVDFMMHIFDEISDEIPEFQEYLEDRFKNDLRGEELVQELSNPVNRDNRNSTEMLLKVTKIGIDGFIKEMLNEEKASYKYLSRLGSEFSYNYCPNEGKEALMGTRATNDEAESSFPGLTCDIQCFGCIGMHSAVSISDAK